MDLKCTEHFDLDAEALCRFLAQFKAEVATVPILRSLLGTGRYIQPSPRATASGTESGTPPADFPAAALQSHGMEIEGENRKQPTFENSGPSALELNLPRPDKYQ
jgi:hypothetical protein